MSRRMRSPYSPSPILTDVPDTGPSARSRAKRQSGLVARRSIHTAPALHCSSGGDHSMARSANLARVLVLAIAVVAVQAARAETKTIARCGAGFVEEMD